MKGAIADELPGPENTTDVAVAQPNPKRPDTFRGKKWGEEENQGDFRGGQER